MHLSAILNDDGTCAASFGEPGSMAGFEGPWHKAVLTITTEDGGLTRSITFALGVAPVVDGPTPAPPVTGTAKVGDVATGDASVAQQPHLDTAHPAAVEAHGADVPGGEVKA